MKAQKESKKRIWKHSFLEVDYPNLKAASESEHIPCFFLVKSGISYEVLKENLIGLMGPLHSLKLTWCLKIVHPKNKVVFQP